MVILHGIGRGARSMRKVEHVFAVAGFRCFNLDYPARRHDLDALAKQVADVTDSWINDLDAPVHFITHSMGGLVARTLIAHHRPARLGRVVMLGPPSQGSEIADLLASANWYRTIFGPAGGQLTTAETERMAARLGPIDYSVGIVAGTRAVDPLSWLLLPKPNDGKVSVERTKLVGMTDHLTLPTTHALMMGNPAVFAATLHFIRFGRFSGWSQTAVPAQRESTTI